MPIVTEADALKDILAWSSDRPAWQRDALRRLVQNGSLSDADIEELTALCRQPDLASEPLSDDHIGGSGSGAPTVALRSLYGVTNVNALAEDQKLTFLEKGVTIVYGDNGAGKSGYVRILKRACRARKVRGRDEPLLPNIYAQPSGPQLAELEFDAGGQRQTGSWTNSAASDPLLSNISVFDSKTANVHVEETNDVAYTPYPMKILESLVHACQRIKAKLDAEIKTIEEKTPEALKIPTCSRESEAGKLIHSLTASTSSQKVEKLATLSPEENARLQQLTEDFSQDASSVARRLRAQRARLEAFSNKLIELASAASDETGSRLAELNANSRTKQEAANLASHAAFDEEPLQGVGSETWRALWEAARAFSRAEPYPDDDFPVTDAGSRCVLCHQELDADAATRLTRFEAFVRDRTQQEAEAARSELSDFIAKLKARMISAGDARQALTLLRDEIGNLDVAAKLRVCVTALRWRLRDISRTGGPSSLSSSDPDAVGLGAVVESLESRATAILADDASIERKAIRAELQALQDRQWLGTIKEDVLEEIKRKAEVAALKKAARDTQHTAITRKNTSLSEDLVTEKLRGAFTQKIDKFKIGRLAIELKQEKSREGSSRFRVGLLHSTIANAGHILSEGEYRCVALAGFLAELSTTDQNSGIIFDDPVSSLDHLHREAIAARLAAEGRKRQVVVFTHDLPFLFLLRQACTQVDDPADKTEVALRHVQRRSDTPGYCRNEAPYKAQSGAQRVSTLRRHLHGAKAQFDRDPDGDWIITAKGLIGNTRDAWEAAVEDAIAPVLRTFSSKVDTKGFSKLSAIQLEDAKNMRRHYGECSDLLHKASDALNPLAPTPDEITQQLDALERWLQDIANRQRKVA